MPRTRSLKQAKAMALLAENGGNVSKAMRDAGYSAVTAATPKKLTTSKAFQDVFELVIPDELLAERHLELRRLFVGHTFCYR